MATGSSSNQSADSDRRARLPSDRRIRGLASEAAAKELTAARRTVWLTLFAWTILAGISLKWDMTERRKTTLLLAHTQAETHLNNETVLRSWIAAHGGVYVASNDGTPPASGRTSVPRTNTAAGDGKPLALINAPYFTRLLQESYTQFYGARGHISSTRPINPANTPTAWERDAYAGFAAGAKEYVSLVEEGDKVYYGFARAIQATESCLRCHTDPSLKSGDVLGAISILVDLAPYRQIEWKETVTGAGTHGAIWLVGLLGVLAASRISIARLRERQDTQQALLESQHLFETMAEHSSDWIFWRNPDGRFRYVSPACERISGYPPEALYADPDLFLDIVHPDDREAFRRHIDEARQGKGCSPREMRIVTREGKVRFISHTCRAIYDGEGHFVGVRGANHDITPLRESEQILINQSRHAAMGEMISNIAHQWRQPISAVGLILQNLKYDFDEGRLTSDILHGYVARGGDLIAEMSSTIDDFRNFFRPEHEPSAFDLRQPIREAVRIVHDSFRAHGIEIRWADEEPHEAFGYPHELAQVLLNLLANAKDAIIERGVAQGAVAIGIDAAADGLVLTVRDNGGGIAADVLPRIFDPYFTTKDSGTGIGLHMTKTIVEQHMHGTIRAENAGDGAQFVLNLPRDLPKNGNP